MAVDNNKINIYLALSFTVLFSTVWLYYFIHSSIVINNLNQRSPISKIEMKVVSSCGVKEVVITDRALLDSINIALLNAKKIDAQVGGIFDTWANITIYKKEKVDVFVEHSPYNGWMIEAGGNILGSEYIFNWIKSYCP